MPWVEATWLYCEAAVECAVAGRRSGDVCWLRYPWLPRISLSLLIRLANSDCAGDFAGDRAGIAFSASSAMLKRDLIGPLLRLPLRLCSAGLARRCAFPLAMFPRGWELVRRWLGIRWKQARTWRVSTACLRAVRGVFPRSFPGVLKTSSLFLQPDQQLRREREQARRTVHFVQRSRPCAH